MGIEKTGMVTNKESKEPLHLVSRVYFLMERKDEGIVYAIVVLGESSKKHVDFPLEA